MRVVNRSRGAAGVPRRAGTGGRHRALSLSTPAPRPMTKVGRRVPVLVAVVRSLTVTGGCVPSDPYPGAYVTWNGSDLVLKTVPCLHTDGGFHSAQLDQAAAGGNGRTVLWRIEKAGGGGVDQVEIGGQPSGYRTTTPLAGPVSAGVWYEAGFDDRAATLLAFRLEDVEKTGFYSTAPAKSEAELLEMRHLCSDADQSAGPSGGAGSCVMIPGASRSSTSVYGTPAS